MTYRLPFTFLLILTLFTSYSQQANTNHGPSEGISSFCAAPTGVSTSGIKLDEIQVGWTAGSSATSSFMEYGLAGFTHGTGTIVTLGTGFGANPHKVTGLTSNTTYEFCIYDICSNGDTSAAVCITDTTLSCPSAGQDTTASTCATINTISLAPYLNGADNTSGLWIDTTNSGALSKGSFHPNVAGVGIHHLIYMTGGPGCPTDTAWISLVVDTLPNPGLSAADTVCDTLTSVDLSLYLGSDFDTAGSWIDVDVTTAMNGSLFNPSLVTAGNTYTFRYRVEANACALEDSASIEIYVDSCATDVGQFEHSFTSTKMRLYPNPAEDMVQIENNYGGSPGISIEVISATGKLIKRINLDSDSKGQFSMEDYSPGIYYIRIATDDHVEVQKILKK